MPPTHEALFPRLVSAIREERVEPVGIFSGSVNYKLMDAFTAWIAQPTPEHEQRCLGYLAGMQTLGHLTLGGTNGVATEAGSPAAHWTFNVASVLGGLKFALKRDNARMRDACFGFLLAEIGLNRAFRWKGRVILPAPRVKDEKEEGPIDGYRDVVTALALGERVRKPERYWTEPLAVAAATMKELLSLSPRQPGAHRPPVLTAAQIRLFQSAPLPKLYLPILRRDLADGGYIAWIEDTPEARAAMGRDACHFVRCAPDGETWGYDFAKQIPEA